MLFVVLEFVLRLLSPAATIAAVVGFGIAMSYLRSLPPQPKDMTGTVSQSNALKSTAGWMVVSSLLILIGPLLAALLSWSWDTFWALLAVAVMFLLARRRKPFGELERQEHIAIVVLAVLAVFALLHPHTGHLLLTACTAGTSTVMNILLISDENNRNILGKAHEKSAHMHYVQRVKMVAMSANAGMILTVAWHSRGYLWVLHYVPLAVLSVVTITGLTWLARVALAQINCILVLPSLPAVSEEH